jgi:hypothetical protein
MAEYLHSIGIHGRVLALMVNLAALALIVAFANYWPYIQP